LKAVQEAIRNHRSELANHDFIRALEGTVPMEGLQRMASRLAFYVLAFQDVLRLTYERCSEGRFRALALNHYREDQGHDLWFLHDLKALGIPLAVQDLFSTDQKAARDASYELLALTLSAEDDSVRFSVALALEGVGAEFFFRIIGLLERMGKASDLRYFARHHQDVEASHDVFAPDTHNELESLEQSDATEHAAVDVVRRTFSIMSRLADHLVVSLRDPKGLAGSPLEPFSNLSGLEVDIGEEARREASQDFGGVEKGRSLGVVRPTTPEEVERVVAASLQTGTKLVARGRGWSQSGQSVARDAVTVDLTRLRTPLELAPTTRLIRVAAGNTWRDLLKTSLSAGLRPPVLPLSLDLTVGGVLSGGGFGSNSHARGLIASHVESVTAVLGDGRVTHCSHSNNHDVFEALLGGVGRAGIITEVALKLEPAPDRVATMTLRYHDLRTAMADYSTLATSLDISHLELFCTATTVGMRRTPSGMRVPVQEWSFTTLVGLEHRGAYLAPDVMRQLNPVMNLGTDEESFFEHATRYDVRYESMRRLGAWTQPHPWFEILLPEDAAPHIATLLASLPVFLGDGHRLLWLSPKGRTGSLAFPPGDRALGFAMMPPAIHPAHLDQALATLRKLDENLRALGGKRYASGWMPDWTPTKWREHFGDDFERIERTVRRCDPYAIFQANLAPLG
jgi:cytokinin dehydrogenase